LSVILASFDLSSVASTHTFKIFRIRCFVDWFLICFVCFEFALWFFFCKNVRLLLDFRSNKRWRTFDLRFHSNAFKVILILQWQIAKKICIILKENEIFLLCIIISSHYIRTVSVCFRFHCRCFKIIRIFRRIISFLDLIFSIVVASFIGVLNISFELLLCSKCKKFFGFIILQVILIFW